MASELPAKPVMNQQALRTTRDLSAAQRSLLNVMQENQYGRIENVPVQGGKPVLDRGGVKVVRVARLGGESGSTSVPAASEFQLKQAVCDLFDELARLRDGEIIRLEFRHGLPFLLETVAAAIPEDRTSAPTENRK